MSVFPRGEPHGPSEELADGVFWIGAHGAPLRDTAKGDVAATVQATFGSS